MIFLAQEAYSNVGGIQRFNIRFIDALKAICQADDELYSEVLIRSDGLQDLPSRPEPRTNIRAFAGSGIRFGMAAIWLALRAQRLILGHINLLPLALIAKALRPRIQVVLVVHGIEVWGDPEFRIYRWWEPMVLRKCVDHILSVSDYTSNKLQEKTNFPGKNITIFPNVVDADRQWPNKAFKEVGNQLLTVTRLGRTEGKKRVDLVIAAVADLLKSGIETTLHIVGDGELRVELSSLAESLGIGSRVMFYGRVNDRELALLYGDADIFVLPSEKEGFGIVYLEAWKAGLPVVAARATAIPEVIDDGVDGFLVDPVSALGLSWALQRLVHDSELRTNMVKRGREKISQKFNQAAFVDRLKQALAL